MDSAIFSGPAASHHSVWDFLPNLIVSDVLGPILEDVSNTSDWSSTHPYMLALASSEQVDHLRSAYVEAWKKWLVQMAKDKNANTNGPAEGPPDGDHEGRCPYPDELRVRSVDLDKKLHGYLDIGRENRERRSTLSRCSYKAFGTPAIDFVLM